MEEAPELLGLGCFVDAGILQVFQKPHGCCLPDIVLAFDVQPFDDGEDRSEVFRFAGRQLRDQVFREVGKHEIEGQIAFVFPLVDEFAPIWGE